MIKKYRKRPIVIEAFKWEGDNTNDIKNLKPNMLIHIVTTNDGLCMCIDTKEGRMLAKPGTWIIKGIKGEIYSCQDDIFKETYDEVQE